MATRRVGKEEALSIAAHERLLDLIIALAHSHQPMTRQEIRSHVNGYSTEEGPRAEASFERMFERDKNTLKELGIPLVTLHGSGHSDDIRYRIDLDEYSLPEIHLSAGELGVLSVAAGLWEGSVLARQARRGLTKLKGITPDVNPLETPGEMRLSHPDETLPALFEALVNNHVVSFSYAAVSTGAETHREVEPWQLRVINNGWYLRGWDRGRDAVREFRLSRITTAIATRADSWQGPTTSPSPAPGSEEENLKATVAIADGAASALKAKGVFLRRENNRDLYSVPVMDPLSDAGVLASYGPAITVLDPPDLRDLVVAKLTGALNHHGGPL